jgi:hypothetical protein
MMRPAIRRSALCAALCLCAATAFAQDAESVLSGDYMTEHFHVRYRPGSRAGASAERTGAAAERDLARICAQLEVKNDAKYSLFLFDDIPELSRVTKTSGNGGFSGGDASYVPFDDDQTRAHELVHIVAKAKLGKTGEEPRSMFFAEGIANALLEYVHGVHVHAVAKYYRKAGKLPRLTEMLGAPDFYAWLGQHPGLNAYDVAASWMRFLVDAHGIAKVKQYYGGKSAKAAFGADLETLEKAWLAALDKYELRPEVEALLKIRNGEGDTGVTAAMFAAKDGWTPIAPDGSSRTWTAKDGALTGFCDSDRWSVYEFIHDLAGDCIVTARVRMSGPGGVQLRLGVGNQAMLLPAGTYVYQDERGVAMTGDVKLPAVGKPFDVALVRRAGIFEVWVDGKKAVSTSASPGDARVGVGVVGGPATFESVRVRPLP